MKTVMKNVFWIASTITYASLLVLYIPFVCKDNCYLSFTRFEQVIGHWCGLRVFLYGDDFDPNGNTLILCNHKSMYDILTTFYISGYFNRVIGFCLKKQVSYVPGIGWWCTLMKFPTLNRNKNDLKILENDTTPFTVIIYPEGTRFNVEKYSENYLYAKQNDYPISKYATLPKSRGSFALSINKKALYQMTLVYMDEHQRIMKGEITTFPTRVYVHIKKHDNIPTSEHEYKTWLHTAFADIDNIYDEFNPANAIEMVPRYKPVDYVIYIVYSLLFIAFGYWILHYTVPLLARI